MELYTENLFSTDILPTKSSGTSGKMDIVFILCVVEVIIATTTKKMWHGETVIKEVMSYDLKW